MAYYQYWNNNKYKNIKQEYGGKRYDSKFEASKAYELDMLKKAGKIKDWKGQVKIEINFKKGSNGEWVLTDEMMIFLKNRGVEARHLFNYFIDFIIEHNDGRFEYLETKGLLVEPGKTKIFLTSLMLENDHKRFFTLEIKRSFYKRHKRNT
jgi:hypothetical protein